MLELGWFLLQERWVWGRAGGAAFPSHSPHCTHFSSNDRKETLCPVSIPSFSRPHYSSLTCPLLCQEALSQLCPGRFMIVFLGSRLYLDLLQSWAELKNLEQEIEHLCSAPAQHLESFRIVSDIPFFTSANAFHTKWRDFIDKWEIQFV